MGAYNDQVFMLTFKKSSLLLKRGKLLLKDMPTLLTRVSQSILSQSIETLDPILVKDDVFNARHYILREIYGKNKSQQEVFVQKLQEEMENLAEALKTMLNEKYSSFQSSLSTFHEVYKIYTEREAQLHLRRHQVEKLQEYFLQHTTNVLETRTEEKSRAVILLIDQMQTLSTAVSVIDTYILSGQYTQAVLHLSSSLEILFSKEMIHLNCFTEIRDTLMLKKQILEEVLTNELQQLLYCTNLFPLNERPLTLEMENIVEMKIQEIMSAVSSLQRTTEVMKGIEGRMMTQVQQLCHSVLEQQGAYLSPPHSTPSLLHLTSSMTLTRFFSDLLSLLKKVLHRHHILLQCTSITSPSHFKMAYVLECSTNLLAELFTELFTYISPQAQASAKLSKRVSIQKGHEFQFTFAAPLSSTVTTHHHLRKLHKVCTTSSVYHLPTVFDLLSSFWTYCHSLSKKDEGTGKLDNLNLLDELVQQFLRTVKHDASELSRTDVYTARGKQPLRIAAQHVIDLSHALLQLSSTFIPYTNELVDIVKALWHRWVVDSSLQFSTLTTDTITSVEANTDPKEHPQLETVISQKVDDDGTAKRKAEYKLEEVYLTLPTWDKSYKRLLWDLDHAVRIISISEECTWMITQLELLNCTSMTKCLSVRSPIMSLCDRCQTFLRKEFRLRCYYYLNQLVLEDFDLKKSNAVTTADEPILALNRDLVLLHRLTQHAFPNNSTILFPILHGLHHLIPYIVLNSLQHIAGRKMTKYGLIRLRLNLHALQQNISLLLYDHPEVNTELWPSSFLHCERYLSLILLDQDELIAFIRKYSCEYTKSQYRAVALIATCTRMPTNDNLQAIEDELR